MSLHKAIESGKEKRKPYKKSKAIDSSCRNHGSCPDCQSNRSLKNYKKNLSVQEQIEILANPNAPTQPKVL